MGRRQKTTEQFIAEAKAVHGEKYDYNKVEYVKLKENVNITCRLHGDFLQTPGNHLKGAGCPSCSGKKRRTTEDFVADAMAIHGDRYDYSKVKYKTLASKIEIICPLHGSFRQAAGSHLAGRNCFECMGTPKKSTEEFIADAKAVHGDAYDYSNVVYETALKKVEIICPTHGHFEQQPNQHLSGQGCRKCGYEKNVGEQRKPAEQFITEAKAVHGDRYNYSKVVYKSTNEKVEIICPEHGIFLQIPKGHLQGQGCRKCYHETIGDRTRLTTEDFVTRAKAVHGDKYGYSKVDYKDSKTSVEITCAEHGSFWQNPVGHMAGHGCVACSGLARKTTEQFISDAMAIHGDRYDYSKVEYENSGTNVEIICPEHGSFWQAPPNHLNGAGCRYCSVEAKTRTTEEFIAEAKTVHADKYDYSEVKYVNGGTDVAITCPVHGSFLQNPRGHLKGNSCPECIRDSITGTTEEFIERSRAVHGDKYHYTDAQYQNYRTEVQIICPKHGRFWQQPRVHLRGAGCNECGVDSTKSTTEEFMKKAEAIHGDRYDYSKVEYENSGSKIEIICPLHGSFRQPAGSHLAGRGCPDCGLRSDMDAVYVWRLLEYPEHHGRLCYKIGMTSERLGIERIEYVRQRSGYTPVDIRVFKSEKAVQAEALLAAVGESAQLTGFSGATECRLFTPEEYQRALAICRDAGTEIEINDQGGQQ